jgi:hypothetical protein
MGLILVRTNTLREQRRGIPRIRRGLPTPLAAFSASSVIDSSSFLDLGVRGRRPFTSPGYRLVTTGSGVGFRPNVNTTSADNLWSFGSRDLDTIRAAVWVFTFVMRDEGVTLNSDSGPVWYLYDGGVGERCIVFLTRLGLRVNYASEATTTVISIADVPYERPVTVAVGIEDATGLQVWVDGVLVHTSATLTGWGASTRAMSIYRSDGSGGEAQADTLQAATWSGYGFELAKYLSTGPQALLEPQSIWVPSAGAPAVPDITAVYADSVTASSVTPRVTLDFA